MNDKEIEMSLSLQQLNIIKLALKDQNKKLIKLAKAELEAWGMGFQSEQFNNLLDEQEHLQRRIDCAIGDIENPGAMTTQG